MNALDAPDSHLLRAAEGWLDLGNGVEAMREWEGLSPLGRKHPDALTILWWIQSGHQNWAECAKIGEHIVQAAPDRPFGWVHRSYALHELKHTRDAHDQLLPALARFPGEWLVPYNLACYLCQLGELGEARRLLAIAFNRGGHAIRATALADADLAALHAELDKLA